MTHPRQGRTAHRGAGMSRKGCAEGGMGAGQDGIWTLRRRGEGWEPAGRFMGQSGDPESLNGSQESGRHCSQLPAPHPGRVGTQHLPGGRTRSFVGSRERLRKGILLVPVRRSRQKTPPECKRREGRAGVAQPVRTRHPVGV